MDEPTPPPEIVPRVAGVVLLGSGVINVAVTVQIVLFAWQQEFWILVAEALFLLIGAAQVVCGAQTYGGEVVYNVLGVPAGLAGTLAGLAWFVTLMVVSATFSPIALVAAAASTLAALAALIAFPASRRITQARRE